MSRELRQVRRYWPRAKYDPSCLYQYSAAGSLIGLMILGGKAEIARAVGQQWIRCRGATIPEAMRAAGFGVRTQSLFRFLNRLARNDCAGRILSGQRIKPHAWYVAPQSRQRPRKGARLGRRKREVQP